ncbi:hypothetical protein EON77_00150 [bacterium]|nr:MAG: hypothetical protein EON77_00150 [bacterium]
MSAPGTTRAPIADLTYRNYDGPLNPPAARWWAIARLSIRLALKKRSFWWWSLLSAIYYIILMVFFYIADSFATNLTADGKNPLIANIVWRDQFVHGFSIGQISLLVIALIVATGAIANDNRANALLVYLSKPCTKLDYIVGKWVGIFIPISLVGFVPMALFWAYGALSFREYGFLTEDPLMLPKLALVAMCGGALHASLGLAVSSMFNQARVAGATYAGIYFISNFVTKAMQFGHAYYASEGMRVPTWIDRAFYASIDGVNIAMAKLILGTSGSAVFGGALATTARAGQNRPPSNVANTPRGIIPSPPLEMFLPIFLILVVGGLLLAYRRVRAVEVV